jgi:hypothetical protein
MKRVASMVGLSALAGGLVACGHGSPRGEGTLHAAGIVHVHHGAATIDLASGASRQLGAGDQVDVSRGDALVALPGGGSLELRAGSSVRFQGGPELEAGDLLVQSARSSQRVGSAMGTITVSGASRLRRDLAVEVGSYRGVTTVAAARTVTIDALQEDTVPSVGLVPDPSPIQLHANDPWDQRFLGTAIDLTSQLDSQSSYVTANSPEGVPHTAAFYRRALPALDATTVFSDALLAGASAGPAGSLPPPGDALVAAAIALSGRGPFADRWRSVFALRQEGGQWGVVVLTERADPAQVLRLVGGALDQAVLTPVALTATAVTTAPASTGAIAAGPLTPSRPSPTPAPLVTLPPLLTSPNPSGSPPPTTAPPALAPLLDPVVNLIQALAGGSSS